MKIATLCDKLSVLPQPGPLFEQDILVIDRLLVVFEAIYDKEKADMAKRESEARLSSPARPH